MIKKIIKDNRFTYQLARKIYLHYSYSRNKSVLEKSNEMKNKYEGKRCFIIGNGPSVNNQDLTKLKNEHTFVCNHFYFHKEINIIKPTFYKMTAPIILNDFFRERVFPETIKRINLYARSNPETIFLFNIQYKKHIERNKLFLKNKVYYFLLDGSMYNETNPEIPSPYSFGESIFFLPTMATYLGFNPIYILGFDHDFSSQGSRKHFYKLDSSLSQRKESPLKLDETFRKNLKWLKLFNKCVQKKGIQIFNAGTGGKLDVFPRVDYESLFSS